ncbi:MAG: PTS sugar transporter subunit IIA [Erysipelotrichaceae bacterium]
MGFFDKLLKKEELLPELNVADDGIVAVADGELLDIKTASDTVFAKEMMGKSILFKFNKNKVKVCAPANGELSALFPTGHAFGITTMEGVEILVHIGINTVETNGAGFKVLEKKQGDMVKAGDPIVEVDIKRLSQFYDMSTILVLINTNGKEIEFIEHQTVKRGQSVIK